MPGSVAGEEGGTAIGDHLTRARQQVGRGETARAVTRGERALGLGAGVALGFDNISYIEELGLEGTGEAPLLIMLLGNERPQPADFRSELV
ncbi:hypothetical protein [Streptomyces sp. NPDC003832]